MNYLIEGDFKCEKCEASLVRDWQRQGYVCCKCHVLYGWQHIFHTQIPEDPESPSAEEMMAEIRNLCEKVRPEEDH